jgi:hypothetical protein
MKFKATLRLEGKTATGIEVPSDVVAALGKGKRPPVYVTIHGYTYRSTVAAYGDLFMLPVSAEVRKQSGVVAGETVEVEVALDEEQRTVALPNDLAQAFTAAPEAKRFFESLSYSHQRRYVLGIENAKTAETRARRVEKTVAMLLEGRKTG